MATATATTKALVEALTELARYVQHRRHCQWQEGEGYCTCGLQEVQDKVRGALEQAKMKEEGKDV